MTREMTIAEKLKELQTEINGICASVGRDPKEVKVLLATKTVEPARIMEAINAGYRLLGENKVQELKAKAEPLAAANPEWHFIGHLQTNKVKDVLPHIKVLHSLDRLSLAEELHKKLSQQGKTLEVLVQVNSSNEESKFGLPPEEIIPFTKQLKDFPTLKVKGLMTLALFASEEEKVRPCFKIMKSLFDQLKAENLPHAEMKELSMGMSGDYKTAIEEGATILRVGTKIFGHRQYPDTHYWPPKNS